MLIGRRGILALAAVLAIAAAPALADELDMERVLELRDEGKKYFDESANVDLSPSERNALRKKAYEPLTKAFEILDAWCDEHPEDVEKLEDLICEIHQMRYWLRKESPSGLLEGEGNRAEGQPDWGPPPEPEKETDPGATPGTGEPPPPRPDPVEEHLKFAEEYEKDHPYDLAGIRDLYLDILEHTLPGTAPYVIAIKKVSEYNSRLKEGYRLLRNEDPDTLKLTGTEERKLVHSLAGDLKSRQADVRLRAAEYLGLLGSGEAARHLVTAIKREDEAACLDMMFAALLKIGGAKVTEELSSIRRWKKEEMERRTIELLATMIERNPVERRYCSITLGEYLFSRFDPVREDTLSMLKGLGPEGGPGLMNGVPIKDHEFKLKIIRALGESGYGPAGDVLGALLIGGAKGPLREYKAAAEEALVKIGRPCVPYLARFVDHNRNGPYTRYVLRQITGIHFKTGAAVLAWWHQNGK